MPIEKKMINLIVNILLIAVVSLAVFSMLRSVTSKINLASGLTGLVVGEEPVKAKIYFNRELTNEDIDAIENIGRIENIDYTRFIITASVPPSQVNEIQLMPKVLQVVVEKG